MLALWRACKASANATLPLPRSAWPADCGRLDRCRSLLTHADELGPCALQVWEVGAQLLGLAGSILVLKAIEVRCCVLASWSFQLPASRGFELQHTGGHAACTLGSDLRLVLVC